MKKPEGIGIAILLTLFILVGVYLRYKALADRELWVDELQQLQVVRQPLGMMLGKSIREEPGGFPGDYLLTRPLALMTSNKWILALPHIFFAALGFYFFTRICLRELSSVGALTVAFLMYDFNGDLIFHALELRPYAILPVFALSLYWYSGELMQKFSWRTSEHVLWVFYLFIILVSHFYGLLMIGLVMVCRSFQQRILPPQKAFQRVAFPVLPAGLLALPIWLYYVSFQVGHPQHYDPFQFSGHTMKHLFSFIFGTLTDIQVPFLWEGVLALVCLSFLLSGPQRRDISLIFVFLIATPILFILGADIRSHYWFIQRQFVWVMPFWALLVGLSADAFLKEVPWSRIKTRFSPQTL